MGKSSSDASTRTTTTTTSNTITNVGLTGQDVNGLLTTFSNFALAEESNLLKSASYNNSQNSAPAEKPASGGNNTLLYVSIGLGVLALLFTVIRR